MNKFLKQLACSSILTLQVFAQQSSADLSFSETYDQLKTVEVTPKATPQVRSGADFFIDLDYIAWLPSQNGLAIAQSEIPLPGATVSSNFAPIQGQKYRPDFKLSSGFKIGFGGDFDYDGWRTYLQYTWYKTTASAMFNPAQDQANLTLWEGNFNVLTYGQTDNLAIFTNISDRGESNWKLKFNVLDWVIERSYFLSRSFVMSTLFGFKTAWNTQDYNITYFQKGLSTIIKENNRSRLIVTAEETYNIMNHQSYAGAGPMIGCVGQWLMSRSFSWVLDMRLSNLWGKFTLSRKDTSNVIDLGGSTTHLANYAALNVRDHFYQLNTVLENTIGFKYSYFSCQDRYKLDGFIGWETQMWFDQNQFIQQGVFGNLTLQGLLVKLALNF